MIVIGLDGLEPTIVDALLAAGQLPHLARLVGPQGVARVGTTYPAQTPVAWSSFATGVNPGGHGIFDFLSRNPRTYMPDNGLNRYEQKNPFVGPKAVNLRRGTPVWERLAGAGVPSVVLRCPCTYPPDKLRGAMLSGMGVPDVRGSFGKAAFYSSGADVAAKEAEHLIPVRVEPDGSVATHLIGPRNPRTQADCQCEIALRVDAAGGRATVRSTGTPSVLELTVGRWSGWLRIKFRVGPFQSVHGTVRFLLVRTQPVLELYASPINFDPESPMFPISTPAEYSAELSRSLGTYYTAGFIEEHNGLVNERFGEEAFLAQCDDVWREREAMMLHALARFDEGLFYCLFDTPDRVQHMLWRFREPEHPANRGEPPAPALRGAIEDQYRRGDAVVGRVLDFVDERTLLIVLSDHGFSSFQRGFHLNTWLLDQGLLALKPGAEPGPDAGDFFKNVAWDRTQAYAMGLSGLFLNLKGREGQGVVKPEDAESLKAQIARGLSGLVDPARGTVAVRSAIQREEVYRGPFISEAPDVLINYAPGYRVSWSSSLGGVAAGEPFEDNTRKWSGDHMIDPVLVPGMLLMNRPFRADGARLIDLAPTILSALGVPPGQDLEGRSLLG